MPLKIILHIALMSPHTVRIAHMSPKKKNAVYLQTPWLRLGTCDAKGRQPVEALQRQTSVMRMVARVGARPGS